MHKEEIKCVSTGKEHKVLNTASTKTDINEAPAMKDIGHGRPPPHVAGKGHSLCPFPGLTIPCFAPAHTLLLVHVMLAGPKHIFIMKSQGACVLGDVGVDGPILG